jgi:hypothetical protein
MPLEMDTVETAEGKKPNHYQFYYYYDHQEELNAAKKSEHEFPKFSPRLYFLILIPPFVTFLLH